MSQMLKSSGAMAAATLTSRIMGMVREMVYSWFMGASWVAGVFQVAFMIPNLFRRLLGEGALTAAFIPIFKEKERTDTETEMWRSANAVISGLTMAAAIITAIAMLGITGVLAAGPFVAKTELMLRLLRVMFPYMLLICLTAVFMGMLNARGHFFIPATGALIMNAVMIASVYFLAPLLGKELPRQIFALAIGVLVAGVAQAAFQLPTLRTEGFRYRWVSPWGDPTVQRVVRQMVPGMIGVAAFQLNVVVTQGVAWWVDPTINAYFNYAVRLMELPQGVFGISLATYLLPTLSGLATDKKYDEFRSTLNQGVDHLMFVNLLAAVLLFVLAEPIIRLLFEHGKFVPSDTPESAFALMCLAPGLLAFSLSNILARSFYALGDTHTPMKISIFCLGINLIAALALVWRLRQGGLAIANSISAIFNASILFYALRRKMGRLELDTLRRNIYQMIGATCVAGFVAWGLCRWWTGAFGHADVWRRLGEVFVPMTAASLVYWGITLWCRVPPATEIAGLLFQKLAPKPKLERL
jgi:putative peptidoglycan lipid II flippase